MRSLSIFKLTAVWAFFGLLALLMVRVIMPVSSQVGTWQPPVDKGLVGVWKENDLLDGAAVERDGIAQLDTVITNSQNQRFASLHDGRIIRWAKNGKTTNYTQLLGQPAGMSFDPQGNLFVVEQTRGKLWRISPNRKVTQLRSPAQKNSLKYLNDIAIAKDGRVFATRSSTKWPTYLSSRAVLEHHNDGAIFMWQGTQAPVELARDLSLPNGIVVAHDQQSLIIAETSEYRISRIWLHGSKMGKKEVLIDNLPGFPTDIALANDGQHYWATFFDFRKNKPLIDKSANKPWLRRLLLNLPTSWIPKDKGSPAVILFNHNGQVVKTLQASEKSGLPGFSSVFQSGNELLLSTASPLNYEDSRVFSLDLKHIN